MNIADQHRIAAIVRTGKAFIEACGDLEMNPEGTDVANPGCLRHVGRRVDAESRAARVVDPYEAEDAAFDAGYAKRHVERALLTLGYCETAARRRAPVLPRSRATKPDLKRLETAQLEQADRPW